MKERVILSSSSKKLLSKLGSVKLALWLILLLAAFAAVGSLELLPQGLPPEQYLGDYGAAGKMLVWLGLDSFYTSYPYRGLLALFCLNLLACALGRSIDGFLNAFARGKAGGHALIVERSRTLTFLKDNGFTIKDTDPISARRRTFTFLAFPLVHLAPILIFAGALWGTEGGFIVTKNIHVGSINEEFFSWKERREITLPFAISVREFNTTYHRPLRIKLQVLLPDKQSAEVSTRESSYFPIEGTDYMAMAENLDLDSFDMDYYIKRGAATLGPFSKGKEEGAPILLRPLGWKGDEKRGEALVSFYATDGALISTNTLAVNEPAVVMGHRVFITAWGADAEEKPFVGIQITRDPGQPLLWVGSISLTLGITMMLFMEGAWCREEDGMLVGRASGRRKLFAKLLKEAGDPQKGTEPT